MADHVVVATGVKGTRALSNRYPTEEGLTAGTTKQVGNPRLVPEQSFVTEKV